MQVDAPSETSIRDIKKAVYKRAHWINNHLKQVKRNNSSVLPREYISGESHFYLGRRYVLKIYKITTQESSVKLILGQLQVRTKNTEKEGIKKLLWEWYRQHARDFIQRRLDSLLSDISWIDKSPQWKLLSMKKQWGSCSAKGILSLNPHLVKAPRECIDYVIIHELCHLKIHNHSKDYYQLLSKTLPGWEAVKGRLDGMSEVILNVNRCSSECFIAMV